jgi:hypothetical protein
MATNPRIPPEREQHRPYEPPEVAELRKRGGFPWALVGLIVAAAILALIAYWLPRAPKRNPASTVIGEEVSQPAPGMISITTPKITAGPTGSDFYLDAIFANHAAKSVTGANVRLTFTTKAGKPVRGPVEQVLALTDSSSGRTEAMAAHPLGAGQNEMVRIPIVNPPADWDHSVPGIEIVNIAVK